MANEILALGSTIERSTDNGATWVKYDAPKTLTVPTVTQEYIEITSLDSTHGFREYQPSIKVADEFSFSVVYGDEAFHAQLAAETSGVLLQYKITFPIEPSQSAPASVIVKGYSTTNVESASFADGMMMTVNVKPSGAANYTEATY